MEIMKNLTEHFTLEELSKTSSPWNNEPNNEAVTNLHKLCDLYLEPLRRRLDKPVVVNSGFRSKKTNASVGGAMGSYHLLGLAVDIHCNSCADGFVTCGILLDLDSKYMVNTNKIAELILSRRANSTWVHLALRKSNDDNTHVIGFKSY